MKWITKATVTGIISDDEGIILELSNLWFPETPTAITLSGPVSGIHIGDTVEVIVTVEKQ